MSLQKNFFGNVLLHNYINRAFIMHSQNIQKQYAKIPEHPHIH